MAQAWPEVHGPVDYLIIEFQAQNANGTVADAILDLVAQGIIRLWDVIVITKEADGTFSGIEIDDLAADHLGGVAAFAGARSGLLGDDDIAEASAAIAPGTSAAVLVYENIWAIPFIAAAKSIGAEVVATARIPADVINEVLAELDD